MSMATTLSLASAMTEARAAEAFLSSTAYSTLLSYRFRMVEVPPSGSCTGAGVEVSITVSIARDRFSAHRDR